MGEIYFIGMISAEVKKSVAETDLHREKDGNDTEHYGTYLTDHEVIWGCGPYVRRKTKDLVEKITENRN